MFSSISHRLEGGIAHGIRGLNASLNDAHALRAQAVSDTKNAACASRCLVPVHGPVSWQRKQSTRKVDIVEKFAEPTPIDPEEWETRPKHIKRQYDRAPQPHRPLRSGSSRQLVGQRLRKVLADGVELHDIMDPDEGRRLLNLHLLGRQAKKRWSRQRLDFAAAATAMLGKYAGTVVSDQYAQAEDLSNELDGYIEEHKKDVAEVDEAEELDELELFPDIPTPGLQPLKSAIIRKTAKLEALPWKEMSDFERRLARNPYAQQLTSAVRLETLCSARLPKDLMTSFNVKMHKETGEPTLVPSTFQVRRFERRYVHRGNPLSLRAAEPHLQYKFSEPPRPLWHHYTFRGLLEDTHKRDIESPYGLRRVERTWSDAEPSDVEREGIDAVNSAVHLLSAPPILSALKQLPKRWKSHLYRRWQDSVGSSVLKAFTLRDDIYEHTLKLMRRRTARYLASLEHTGQPILSPFEGHAQAFRSAAGVASAIIAEPTDPGLTEQQFSEVGGRDAGALLWFGERWGDRFPYSDEAGLPEAPEQDVDSPAPCQTPIYNMQQLLTETEYDWLRSLTYTTDDGCIESVYKSRQVLVRDSIWSTWPLDWVWRLHLTLTSGSPDDNVEIY